MIQKFLQEVIRIHKTGAATEHSYRPALQELFNSLSNEITAINEPKRTDCGAPDFIIQRGELAVGHIEAKDLHIGLRGMKDTNKNQQERYLKALPNLIYTNFFTAMESSLHPLRLPKSSPVFSLKKNSLKP